MIIACYDGTTNPLPTWSDSYCSYIYTQNLIKGCETYTAIYAIRVVVVSMGKAWHFDAYPFIFD